MIYTRGKHLEIEHKKLLYSKLTEKICQYIEDHNLQIGDRLPSERKWAAEMEVSRASLREALRELENQGIIRVEVGRGAFVADKKDSRYIMISMAQKDFMSLFEIKTALESYVLIHLFGHITKEKLDMLEKIASDMIEQSQNGIFPQEMDTMFHRELVGQYPNKEITKVIMDMISTFEEFKAQYFNKCDGFKEMFNKCSIETLPYHLKLIRNIRNHDIKKIMDAYQKIVDIDIQAYSIVYGEEL